MTDMRDDEGRRLHALAVEKAGCDHGSEFVCVQCVSEDYLDQFPDTFGRWR